LTVRYKNTLSLFSFFIVFLLIFTSFLMINVDAKTDSHIEYAGTISALAYLSYEHIVMDENGDKIGVAFIGLNGDSTYVSFHYRDLPSINWANVDIRQTTNFTYLVSIARDIDFNIHAVYQEKNDTTHSLFYKFFQWSDKTWYLSPKAITKSPLGNMGFCLSIGSVKTPFGGDIKVDILGNIHVVFGIQESGANAENIYARYSAVLGYWDLFLSLDYEATNQGIYAFHSIALDSDNNIYCTYAKKQDSHYSKANFWDSWFTKSINGGDSWSDPSLIVNQTYPNSVISSKLIIDTSNILHNVYYANYSSIDGSYNYLVGYAKSVNYGSTWSFMNLTDRDNHYSYCSISMDVSNVIYFTYSKQTDYAIDYNGIYGKKYENGILGDEVQIIDKNGSHQIRLNLVFSNTYGQYADSGVIGIYADWSVANHDIRYLELDYNDFLVGQYNLRIIPYKPTYYTFDVIKTYVDNPTTRPVAIRYLNATNVYVEPMGIHAFASGTDWYDTRTIPSMYDSGTWRVQASPYTEGQAIVWGVAGTEYLNFTVQDSGLDYFITAYPSWVIRNNYVSFDFSAKAGEMYRIELWNPYPFGGGGYGIGNITTTTYGIDQTVVYQYGFLMVDDGSYSLNLYNATSGDKIAFSNSFHVGSEPEDNTYSVAIADRYKYTDRPKITISRWGSQNYEYHVYNENNIQIASGTSGLSEHEFTLYMTASDIGTAYIRVYNLGHTPSDSNAVYIEFQIYDPQGATGDPIIDTFISIPTWIKAIVGVIIVLGFVFIPFILSQYIVGSHKLDVPPVIYAICGGIGVTLCTLLGLFGWEIMFFICVIAGISLVISYVWQQKGD